MIEYHSVRDPRPIRCRLQVCAYRTALAILAGCAACPGEGTAQEIPPEAPSSGKDDIVITGQRTAGSAVGAVDPTATLDQAAIQALGATDLKTLLERLKTLTTSASGGDPVYLLNSRRMSSMNELYSLPQEAMEKIEVLPESEAARFGFPAIVRVMNFITKKRFRAVKYQQSTGTTTEGGGETNYVEVTAARIDGPRRATLTISHLRLNPVLQSERAIVPDPDTLYAVGGNITGVGGATIDPALDALVGNRVTIAAVPEDLASRRTLAGYVAGAGAPAVTDIRRYRSLQQRSDRISVDGTVAAPIGKSMSGSLNLSMEAQRSTGLNGLAPALLSVPGGSGVLPFAGDVLLYRYLPDAVLRQRNTSLTLHGSGLVQGSIRRWGWNVTTSYDRVRGLARSQQGVPIDDLQASIDAGGDPLAIPSPEASALRQDYRSRTVTGTLLTKAVANGPLVKLPAGDAQITLSGDYARSSSSGSLPGLQQSTLDLTRTTKGASVNADFPIASANQDVLAFLGQLSVNGMIGVSDVSNYGRLVSSNYGLTWSPVRPIQLIASVNEAQTPPAIALLTNPTVTTPNTPFFDFTTGTSVLVTTIAGGNTTLAPERRRIVTLGVAVSPIKAKDLRLTANYLETRIGNQTATLGSATAAFQSAFADAFQRNAAGQLVSADLRPVNIAREREKKMQVTLSLSTPIGRTPRPQAPSVGTSAKDSPPPPAPKSRPQIYVSMTTTWRLDDRLSLRSDLPVLDLLDGDTLTGTGGRPRWETELSLSGSLGAANIGLYGRLQGPTRIRSDLEASDLRFSGRTWLVPYASLKVEQIVKRPWAKAMMLQFTVENLLNDRVNVRDRLGRVPNRFQAAYIDPLGRSVRLGLRKLF
ncbi:TonB-dependent receptor domain-containing protein [Sphingomonas sp. CFBP 13733]|uniref:TonB-dependent receptor domain-containing protein n=1 Tax=Sphingomonas sp. CFBP 13733 TaxID=2775291 RepID=UPI0018D9B6EE|nr:TonB-dependent receptor [Sphingomonas sp. CFBP 13733]